MLIVYLGTLVVLSAGIMILAISMCATKKDRWVLFFLIPTMMIALIINSVAIDSIMGRPLRVVPDKFTFLSKIEARPFIHMWIVREGDTYPVTITIPWSEEMSKRAAEANRKTQLGIGQVRDKNKEGNNFAPGEFIFHNLNHADGQPK